LSHAPAQTHAVFDDEHGDWLCWLVPVMRLAERCELADLSPNTCAAPIARGERRVEGRSIVAVMACGADSIDELDVAAARRDGQNIRRDPCPSTLGSFLRCLNWGNVRQLGKVSRLLLAALASHARCWRAARTLAFIDIRLDAARVYSPRKQGAGFGHTKIQGRSVLVRGLNALARSSRPRCRLR